MYVYLFVTLYILLLSSLSLLPVKQRVKDVGAFFGVIALALFWGLRAPHIGWDSITYIEIFKDIESYPFGLEPAFRLFIYILRLFSDNTHFFLLSISLLTYGLIMSAYRRISPKWFLVIFALFFTMTMNFQMQLNILRQGIAMGFFLHAVASLLQNKKLSFWCFALCAFLFHVSSIFLFFLPLLKKVKLNRVVIVGVVFYFVLIFRISLFSTMLAGMSNFHWIIGKIRQAILYMEPATMKLPYLIIIMAILTVFLFWHRLKSDEKFTSLFRMFLLGVFLLGTFHEGLLLADRTMYYFYPLAPILILWGSHMLFKQKGIITIILLTCSIVWSLKSIYYSGYSSGLKPYEVYYEE